MSHFDQLLVAANPPSQATRQWVFVGHDQLHHGIGPLARLAAGDAGIVLIEGGEWGRRRPYHAARLALIWANQRHFALEQARRGVAVRYVRTAGTIADALRHEARDLGPLRLMEPAEYEMRSELRPLIESGVLVSERHDGWLTTPEQFLRSGGPPWKMDSFYRLVRRESHILMDEAGKPLGGKYSFDTENRLRWQGDPPAPEPPRFPHDPILDEVCAMIRSEFPDHPGTVDPATIPVTAEDASALWRWAREQCLHSFGPYEDAMSTLSSGLFHTRISPVMNIHRILPRDVVADIEQMAIPMASKEGFIRQVLGWREFVRHVHVATDGFRSLPGGPAPVAGGVGDGGWGGWSGKAWPTSVPSTLDGGSTASYHGADLPVPPAFWGRRSGLACLDNVVEDVWREAWSHHITRLMILGNIATLIDIAPRDLADWFWIAYADAWDWVVEPNVMAMATHGVGNLMTTKPYIAGANYISKMSNYCEGCQFDPKKDCPIANLYWAFLDRHQASLESNPRMGTAMMSLRKRTDDKRRQDRAIHEWVSGALQRGEFLTPAGAPKP